MIASGERRRLREQEQARQIRAYAQQLAELAPPLTPAQRSRLSVVFANSRALAEIEALSQERKQCQTGNHTLVNKSPDGSSSCRCGVERYLIHPAGADS